MLRSVALAALWLAPLYPAAAGEALLAAPFTDHAVLQRDRPILLWGHANPGALVTISLAGHQYHAPVLKSGEWRATLPAMSDSGPYSLIAESTDGRRQQLDDLLIGDVFLCSGQSNMAMPVKRALNSHNEIPDGDHPDIRILTIDPAGSTVPQRVFAGQARWQRIAPTMVGDVSAVCYFFARELQKTTPRPLGIISAAWGGAYIRAFMSGAALRAAGDYRSGLDLLVQYERDPTAAVEAYAKDWKSWWRSYAGNVLPWRDQENNWAPAPLDLGGWDDWEERGVRRPGLIFYRAHVTLSAGQTAEQLNLGRLGGQDLAWINGRPVGAGFGFGADRRYALPPGTVREGDNILTLASFCLSRGCGLLPRSGERGVILAGGTTLPLLDWHYRPANPREAPPIIPWGDMAGLSTAYNAMIAPIGSYGLKAALWYQGESDTDQPARYGDLLRGLLADWRRQFGMNLPILITQLPNFGAPPTQPGPSAWAELREAQRRAAAEDGNTALVTTIDLGERNDDDPANKREVARRLAARARNLLYGARSPVSVRYGWADSPIINLYDRSGRPAGPFQSVLP